MYVGSTLKRASHTAAIAEGVRGCSAAATLAHLTSEGRVSRQQRRPEPRAAEPVAQPDKEEKWWYKLQSSFDSTRIDNEGSRGVQTSLLCSTIYRLIAATRPVVSQQLQCHAAGIALYSQQYWASFRIIRSQRKPPDEQFLLVDSLLGSTAAAGRAEKAADDPTE
eukprot:3588445-Pleurochrysis_carterae.AAC.1